ncbi:MAG: transporter substrate-binding domain-containing protein [Hyphomicrobiales bacterium]
MMKQPNVTCATASRLCLAAAAVFLVASTSALPQPQDGATYRLPLFRHVETGAKAPQIAPTETVRLLADGDFPPFSFATGTGTAAGLAVDLALAACAEIKLRCEVVMRPYGELAGALARRDGDVIIAGPRPDPGLFKEVLATRPYFRSLGRFAVPGSSALAAGDVRTLGGKRIGMVKGTAHAAWLEEYYSRSTLMAFDSEAEAQEALRTGSVDALFGDSLRLIYWIAGSASRGCCRLLSGAYVDRGYFSRSMVFLVRKDREDIRDALDHGLDRLQGNGTTEKIFNTYVPLNPW